MVIYVIRHGETDWNTKHWLQGTTDIPLNRNGIEVAEITSEALKGIPLDVIFSSPLKRAYQTAEIMKRERQIPLIVDERLKEISFGCFEGLCCTGPNYNIPDPDFPNFFQNPAHYNPPEGGESIAELCVRGTDFLTWLIDRPEYQDKTVLISAHGALVKALLSSLLITDLKEFWKGGVHKNCAGSIIDVEHGTASVRQENVIYYDKTRRINYFE